MQYAVNTTVCYEEKASRLALFTRTLWMFLLVWVIWAWAFVYGFVFFFQAFYILIFGKRHKKAFDFQLRFNQYISRIQLWLNLLTDERPKVKDQYEPAKPCATPSATPTTGPITPGMQA